MGISVCRWVYVTDFKNMSVQIVSVFSYFPIGAYRPIVFHLSQSGTQPSNDSNWCWWWQLYNMDKDEDEESFPDQFIIFLELIGSVNSRPTRSGSGWRWGWGTGRGSGSGWRSGSGSGSRSGSGSGSRSGSWWGWECLPESFAIVSRARWVPCNDPLGTTQGLIAAGEHHREAKER